MTGGPAAIRRGPFLARLAGDDEDIARVLALRSRLFRPDGSDDLDPWDQTALHLMVEADGLLVGTARVSLFRSIRAAQQGYSGQVYDLARIAAPGRVAEVGRLCVAPEVRSPDVLRLLFVLVAALARQHRVRWLLGCASFTGADRDRHAGALAALWPRQTLPPPLRPARKATERVERADVAGAPPAPLPPLLAAYVGMGAQVSDHAVIDRSLDRLHVLCLLDVRRVPPGRAAILAALGR